MSQPEIIVVDSGPAGVSAAEAFRRHQAETPVRILTADPAVPSAEWYTERRIEVVNARVERIDPDGRFVIAEGQRHPYSALILASGSAPTPLPVPGGERGAQGGRSRIVVGADMRTSASDVFAAGDVALAFNPTAGRHIAIEHWQDAVDQGAIAGAAAAGADGQWDGVPGFWTTIGVATVKYHAWGDG